VHCPTEVREIDEAAESDQRLEPIVVKAFLHYFYDDYVPLLIRTKMFIILPQELTRMDEEGDLSHLWP